MGRGERNRPARVIVEPVTATPIRGPHADGTGRWYWQARLFKGQGGGHRTIPLARPWATRDEVARELAEIIARDGLNEPAEPAHEVRTVRDLLEAWLGARAGATDLTSGTKRAALLSARRLVGPEDARTALGAILLEQLDRRHLEHHRDTAAGAEATIARDLKTLRSAWRWGREVGHAPIRDLPSLRRGGKGRSARPVYSRFTPTEAEVGAVLGKLRRPWVRQAVILLYATGARIGEIATLRWGAVAPYARDLVMPSGPALADLDGEDFRLNWTARDCASIVVDGKTGPREVQLHPDVAAELRSWRPTDVDPSEPVLGVSPKHATTRVQAELAAAAEALELPRLSPNGLRRAAERALYARRAPDVAASLLGHSAETAIRTYRQVTADERAALVAEAGLSIPQAPSEATVVPFDRKGR